MSTARPGTDNQGNSIAIVGMGCLFPNAQNLAEFWRSIRCGEDGISETPSTHWSIEDYVDSDPKASDKTNCGRGGFLSPVPFDPTEFGIPPTILEATDTSQLLGLVVAKAALEDAGYGEGRDFNRERVSVILGATGMQELVGPLSARLGHPLWRKALRAAGVAPEVAEDVVRRIADGYVPWQENSFPGLLGNVVAGRIANRLNLRGTNCVVDAACASSLSAMHLAMLELIAGRCDMALTGGADTLNDIFMYMCFSATTALSPTGDVRPFSSDADGTVLGEGLGMLVLKRLADAQRDGDRIYAVIRGVGTSSDGRSQSIYAPHSAGQARALRNAYRLAGFGPDSVDLIEAHGTGTKVGDVAEFEALRTVFREAQSDGTWCALGSIKSQIGHTKAAAGAAGLIKAALAIYYRSLPPTIKVGRPSDKLGLDESPFYLSTTLRPWIAGEGRPRRAGVSSFGFGGSNFHVVLEEHQATLPEAAWDGSVQIIAMSADSSEELIEQLDDWLTAAVDERFSAAVLAYKAAGSRRAFSTGSGHRLVIVVERGADLTGLLQQAKVRLAAAAEEGAAADGRRMPNVFYGCGRPAGKVAFLFPGQGSQYVGMGRDLTCTFPEAIGILAEADAAADSGVEPGERRLGQVIYPSAVFGADAGERHEAALRQTDNAQPALGAVSLGMCRVLERFGVRPELAAGHSYGELVALCAAGWFDSATLHRLSRLRGRLMAEDGGDRGTMLAVHAPLDELAGLVDSLSREGGTGVSPVSYHRPEACATRGSARGPEEERAEVVIANRNAPGQGVLSGDRESIGRAVGTCASRGWATKLLPVSGAFHSRLMDGALGPFRQALEAVPFEPGAIPVFANTTGDEYPADAAEARSLLGQQLIKPVDFVREIEGLYLAGGRTFVEVGPKAVLSGLVRSILGERPHVVITLDASCGRGSGVVDLARSVALLAALGHRVDLACWEKPATEPRMPKMVVPLVGANYRSAASRELSTERDSERAVVLAKGQSCQSEKLAQVPGSSAADSGQLADCSVSEGQSRDYGAGVSPAALSPCGTGVPPVSINGQDARTAQGVSHGQDARATGASGAGSAGVPPATVQARATQSPILAEAMRTVQEGLQAMQALQRQTAEAHQRFLELQDRSHQACMDLIAGQQRLVGQSMGIKVSAATTSEAAPQEPPALAGGYVPKPAVVLQPTLPAQTPPARIAAPTTTPVAAAEPVSPAAPATISETVSRSDSPDDSDGASVVLEVVAEKTGYPVEMLDLDMDIEADLGIDSIKRVEIVAAIEERVPDWPGVAPEYMGGLRTLREIVAFMSGGASPAAAGGDAGQRPSPVAGGQAAAAGEAAPSECAPGNSEAFGEALLAVVAELTGYPVEMLELDMDMEADLGIDSIKRVEILAAVEARIPELPPVRPEYMGSLRTLRQIVESVVGEDSAPASAPASTPASTSSAALPVCSASCGPVVHEEAEVRPESAEVVQRQELVAVALPACLAGGLALAPGHEVWVTDDGGDLAAAIVARLVSLGHAARVVRLEGAGDTGRSAPVGGFICLAPPVEADGASWDARSERLLKDAFALTSAVAADLRSAAAKGGALFATVSRMDGAFGLIGGRFDATQGGLAGLAKTAGREWSDVRCRAIDVALDWQDADAAACAIVGELSADGPVEVGLDDGVRRGLETVAAPLDGRSPALEETQAGRLCHKRNAKTPKRQNANKTIQPSALSPQPSALSETPAGRLCHNRLEAGEVVVITGGARGVAAECAVALARACRPTLVLLGRTPPPGEEPTWLTGLTGESEIKAAILKHRFADRSRPAPTEVQGVFDRVTADREVRRNMARMEEAGGRVVYRSVDVRDAAVVRSVLDEVCSTLGPIRGLVHAAGALADRLIVDKTAEQFDTVFDTKVVGLGNLLGAVRRQELRHVVFFSSVSGRYGNQGQADYAMANEVLNKVAQRLAVELPSCRVVSMNWGPWDGGMVTPALRREFLRRGVGLIPPEAGGRCFVDELGREIGGAIEVVVGSDLAGNAGSSAEEAATAWRQEFETSGGEIAGGPPRSPQPAESRAQAAGNLSDAYGDFTLAFERRLDLERHPFLRSHVLDGRPVLPVAVMMEWLGQAAVHGNPGLLLHGFDDLRVLKGVVLGDGPVLLRFLTANPRRVGALLEIDVELRGGGPGDAEVVHARATAVLASALPAAPIYAVPQGLAERAYELGLDAAYSEVLFHGETFRGIEAVEGYSAAGLIARVRAAPAPGEWMTDPLRSDWLADPLVLDAAFQMAILWCYEELGVVSLPTYIGRYRQFRTAFPGDGVRAILEVLERSARKMRGDFTFLDPAGGVVARLEGYECAADASLMAAFRRGSVAEAAS